MENKIKIIVIGLGAASAVMVTALNPAENVIVILDQLEEATPGPSNTLDLLFEKSPTLDAGFCFVDLEDQSVEDLLMGRLDTEVFSPQLLGGAKPILCPG